MRGTLFLIVGPSGAGKDVLIAAARERLAIHGRFVFPQRVITRPRRDGDEIHSATGAETFATLEREGQFALSWRAHGVSYGIPSLIEAALSAGKHVVANVSRAVVAEARHRFAPSCVIEVTAPGETRAARLRLRGREDERAITSRLEREQEVVADFIVSNDGALDTAVALFLDVLSKVENSSSCP